MAEAYSQLRAFITYCEQVTGSSFATYPAFESFAIAQYRQFWHLLLDWSQIMYDGDTQPVCNSDYCEAAAFFPNLYLNYAENLLRQPGAVISCHADGSYTTLAADDLRKQVIHCARFLQDIGIQPGDRVVAIARSNVEVIIAALATTAIGAIFSSCAHDMGTTTVLSRFQRLEPKVLFANCTEQLWDVGSPLVKKIKDIITALPSLDAVISLDDPIDLPLPVYRFQQLVNDNTHAFSWQRFPFNHPLFILFSSGTTGTPKCIMHGTGGTLLEHVKEHRLHGDLNEQNRMFFQTSCGWMMWNWQLSALACGAEVVVYDGPLRGPETLWQIVADRQITVFGTNPAYLQFTATAGFQPRTLNLAALRSVLSTGSILYPQQFDWVTEHVKNIPVQSISGGTDILGCFVLGNPLLPVYRGHAQCRSLGMDVRSLPPNDTVGELVCANPFPSRPIGFYGEPTTERYHEAYFSQNADVWTHGDLIELNEHGAIIHGRSDSVLNIRGVRIGPAEIYRILQSILLIVEAMAVEQTDITEAGGARLILLVVLRSGVTLNDALKSRIRRELHEQGHAIMIPADIIQMDELPITHSGKRSEAAARDAVNGRPISNRQALLNPACLDDLASKVPRKAVQIGPVRIDQDDLEQQLCALGQQCLGASVYPLDNYLGTGDSLTVLSFLLEVLNRTKATIPLATLATASTIHQLAMLLQTGGLVPYDSTIQIREVTSADIEQVCRLLDGGFKAKLPWERIFTHPWQPKSIPHGFVLTDNQTVVGFIGLIGASRNLNGKSGVVCNLTSWYVKPRYRGWSNALLATATQFDEISYTSLTPGKTSQRVLQAMGFSIMGRNTYLPPLMHFFTVGAKKPILILDRDAIHERLGDQGHILDDLGHECLPMLVIDKDQIGLVVAHRRRMQQLPYSEIVYCSAPALLAKHLERIKLAFMRRQHTVGLLTMNRRGIKLPNAPLYRSSQFTAQELDKLYSELTLLPI